jgi:soluble lytic murein transglycosylase-like protein
MTTSRSNSHTPHNRRQAAPQSGGCLSGFLIPPLAALFVSLLLAMLAGGLSDSGAQIDAHAAPVVQQQADANGQIAALFTPEVQYWSANIVRWATQHGLDPNLAATVMQIESCGHPEIRSSAGATGLFQVMPFHFKSGEVMSNPDTNALRGMDYLRRSLETAAGNPRLAMAGYNGGIGVIGRAESRWHNETVRYAYWGSGIYADASQNRAQSARLDEWLKAGGASLCAKARQRLGVNP